MKASQQEASARYGWFRNACTRGDCTFLPPLIGVNGRDEASLAIRRIEDALLALATGPGAAHLPSGAMIRIIESWFLIGSKIQPAQQV